MPLYEYVCSDCGDQSEILMKSSDATPECPACNGANMVKQMSTTSSMTGAGTGQTMPGPGDTACCGSAPGQGAGCAGPGSCCGKTF